ncbi:MAG: hypothetical protein KAR13_15020, partial [Desulfobulbaceae bacterium]|nr:hypothetical protein [Desulfobulbaceae bacterium]
PTILVPLIFFTLEEKLAHRLTQQRVPSVLGWPSKPLQRPCIETPRSGLITIKIKDASKLNKENININLTNWLYDFICFVAAKQTASIPIAWAVFIITFAGKFDQKTELATNMIKIK